MSIIRREKTDNYSVIHNECFRDETLSARAKGIFGYLMSLPDDWVLYKAELNKHFTEGRDAINKAFNELMDKGYITKKTRRSEDGKTLSGWDYTIYESVGLKIRKSDEPVELKISKTDNQSDGKTATTKDVSKLITKDTKEALYDELLKGFNLVTGRQLRTLGPKCKRQLNALIKEGHTVGDVLIATDRANANEWFRNPEHKKYLTPEFITRVDKFQAWFKEPDEQSTGHVQSASV